MNFIGASHIVVGIGAIRILCAIGKSRSRSSRNFQELQSDVVGFGSRFGDREDRISLQIALRFDCLVKRLLVLYDWSPGFGATPDLPFAGDRKIVGFVWSFERQQCPGGSHGFAKGN